MSAYNKQIRFQFLGLFQYGLYRWSLYEQGFVFHFFSQKGIADAQALVIAEALKAANIDIVGGETMFFEKIIGSITGGKTIDSFVSNSSVLSNIQDKFLKPKKEQKEKIEEAVIEKKEEVVIEEAVKEKTKKKTEKKKEEKAKLSIHYHVFIMC